MTAAAGTLDARGDLAREAVSEMMDEQAFEALYRQTARPLWAYINRALGDPSRADDLLQDTYLRLLRSRAGAERRGAKGVPAPRQARGALSLSKGASDAHGGVQVPSPSFGGLGRSSKSEVQGSPPRRAMTPQEIRAWLYRIASNLVVDHFRRARRERAAAELAPVEETAGGRDVALRIDMERVFGQLRPEERVMMWLAYVEGSGHREIAEVVGVKEKSVRVLLFRARKRLAALLKAGGVRQGEQ